MGNNSSFFCAGANLPEICLESRGRTMFVPTEIVSRSLFWNLRAHGMRPYVLFRFKYVAGTYAHTYVISDGAMWASPPTKCSGDVIEMARAKWRGRTECAPTEMFRLPYNHEPASESRLCLLYRVSEVTSDNVGCGVQGAARSLPGQGQSPCGFLRQSLRRIVKAEP